MPAASTLIRTSSEARRRNGLFFHQFQDFGTAEPSDADVSPGHALTVSAIVLGVMLERGRGTRRKLARNRRRVTLNRSPRRSGNVACRRKAEVADRGFGRIN